MDCPRVYNEWGRLREVFVGIEDRTVEPEYIEALQWLPDEGITYCKEYGGKATEEVFPEFARSLQQQLDDFVKVLEAQGVTVHRTQPVPYEEERAYLSEIQRGNMLFGGADFFRVIGSNVLLLNSFRMPFRRKQVWAVRRVLEPLLTGRAVRYCATPPPSPHYSEDDLYLENGDIMVDGFMVYVGISGNASNLNGVRWLQQYLGSDYSVMVIPLRPELFHLDWIVSLNRPGLLTYAPEALTSSLPEPLHSWDKIEITLAEAKAGGANNLSLSAETIIVPDQHERIGREYEKRGMKVIKLPLDMTIAYGSGPRCLAGVLRRDP